MRRRQIVLVVDDDPAICRLLQARLTTDAVQIITAGCGAEAERIIAEQAESIDLILLDVGLPDTDGFTLCESIRRKPTLSEIPVIFLTGRDSSEDTLHGFEAGGTDYITKPFDHAVLHARVSAALRTQRFFHERCEAEATLRRNEQRYRDLTDHCFDMISRHDRDGRYIDVSPACAQLLGCSPEQLIGRSAYELIHPDDQSVVAANHQRLFNHEPIHLVTYRLRRADNSYVWVESVCRLLPESECEINCVTRDVTSRKKAQEALRASEAKLQAITAQLPAIVWTTDLHSTITSMSGAMLSSFDLDGAVMIGRTLEEVMPAFVGDEWKQIIEHHQQALRGQSVHGHFTRASDQDDERQSQGQREFDVRIEPLLDPQGECVGCLGIAFDITERRRIEEAERSRAALEEAVVAMEQVLGVIGHELRTPLAGLRVMAEFLLGDTEQSNDTSSFLQMIHKEVIRMASMVNELLEAARINSGKAQWKWSTFDLTDLCQDVLDIVRHATSNPQVTLGCEVITSDGRVNEPLTMNGDRDAIHRLFVNLVANAGKHTREGLIMVKAVEDDREDGRWIDIEIRDTGEGMPQHILDKLGVPFALNAGMIETGNTDSPAPVHGCGLGLAICKGIALAHGGSIRFESEPGMGTTVYVRLRADLHGAASASQQSLFVNQEVS